MSSKWILPVVVLGGLGLGGFFLFATPQGQRMLSSITSGLSGYDDPFKYYTEDTADAWDPDSKMYKKIQKRIWDKKKKDKNKKVQQEYIESYLDDAF